MFCCPGCRPFGQLVLHPVQLSSFFVAGTANLLGFIVLKATRTAFYRLLVKFALLNFRLSSFFRREDKPVQVDDSYR